MSEIYLILHQVFWVLISFLLFFTLMNAFVFKRVQKILEKRSGYIEKLNEQIDEVKSKTIILENNANKIVNEEIPSKQKFFVEKTLEPIITDFQMNFFNEKEMLEEKLDHQRHRYASIKGKMKDHAQLASNINHLIEKINKKDGELK